MSPSSVLLRAAFCALGWLCAGAALAGAGQVKLAIPNSPQLIGSFMNEDGEIVGVDNADRTASHAFLVRNDQVSRIGTPRGGTNEVPTDINDAGDIVGETYVVSGSERGAQMSNFRAFLYRNGAFTLIDLPNSHAFGVNDSGQVVGYYTRARSDTGRRAFVYTNGGIVELGSLGGADGAAATKINRSGQITGSSATAKGTIHAFLYSNEKMADLGTLAPADNDRSGGVDINDAGTVIGYSTGKTPGLHAFIYENGSMRDLGSLGGATITAFKINNAGMVVGTAEDASGRFRAFLYRSGEMADLNTLVDPSSAALIELQSATSINDRGVILAGGVDRRTGVFASYLVTPRLTAVTPTPRQNDPQSVPSLEGAPKRSSATIQWAQRLHEIRYDIAALAH